MARTKSTKSGTAWSKVRPLRYLPKGTDLHDGATVTGKQGIFLTSKDVASDKNGPDPQICAFYGVPVADANPFRVEDLDAKYRNASDSQELLAAYSASRKTEPGSMLRVLVLDAIGREMYSEAIAKLRPAKPEAISKAWRTILSSPEFAGQTKEQVEAKLGLKIA